MDDFMELTELDFNDNSFGQTKKTNFGGGLELLMNDKVRENSRPTSDIDIEDLSRLENELNDLVEEMPSSSFAPKSDLFDTSSSSSNNNFSCNDFGNLFWS